MTSTFAAASSRSFARASAHARRSDVVRVGAMALTVIVATGCWPSSPAPSVATSPSVQRGIAPALDAITEADLRRDLFAMAGDAMRGREAGTLDEMRATAWVAERAREAGLQPAGDDETFFQWWPMRRSRLSENSQLTIGGRALRVWKDAVVLNAPNGAIDLPIVFVSDTGSLRVANVSGKAVAMVVSAVPTQPLEQFTIRGNFQSTLSTMIQIGRAHV